MRGDDMPLCADDAGDTGEAKALVGEIISVENSHLATGVGGEEASDTALAWLIRGAASAGNGEASPTLSLPAACGCRCRSPCEPSYIRHGASSTYKVMFSLVIIIR
jgi:hypothetical protein